MVGYLRFSGKNRTLDASGQLLQHAPMRLTGGCRRPQSLLYGPCLTPFQSPRHNFIITAPAAVTAPKIIIPSTADVITAAKSSAVF
jgi:hypothetical protein